MIVYVQTQLTIFQIVLTERMRNKAMANAMESMETYRIGSLSPAMHYIHDFLSVEEEASILQKARDYTSYFCFTVRYTRNVHRLLTAARYPATAGSVSPTADCNLFRRSSRQITLCLVLRCHDT